MSRADGISARDFGQMVFKALRTGVPDIPYIAPKSNRTRDIDAPTMLAQRQQRAREKRRVAEHNRGWPIVTGGGR